MACSTLSASTSTQPFVVSLIPTKYLLIILKV
nr:MAG TPA: hypothetical protein [Caudoviricetes sp.]